MLESTGAEVDDVALVSRPLKVPLKLPIVKAAIPVRIGPPFSAVQLRLELILLWAPSDTSSASNDPCINIASNALPRLHTYVYEIHSGYPLRQSFWSLIPHIALLLLRRINRERRTTTTHVRFTSLSAKVLGQCEANDIFGHSFLLEDVIAILIYVKRTLKGRQITCMCRTNIPIQNLVKEGAYIVCNCSRAKYPYLERSFICPSHFDIGQV